MLPIELNNPAFAELESYQQKLSNKVLKELKKQAKLSGLSLSQEIAIRIFATFVQADAFGVSNPSQRISDNRFSPRENKEESEQSRQGWLYLHILDKKRLYLNDNCAKKGC